MQPPWERPATPDAFQVQTRGCHSPAAVGFTHHAAWSVHGPTSGASLMVRPWDLMGSLMR